MLNNYKGYARDGQIMDLSSISLFNNEHIKDLDHNPLYHSIPLDSYPSMTDDIHSGLLITPNHHQDQIRSFTSPNPIPHPLLGTSAHLRPLNFDFGEDKLHPTEVKTYEEDDSNSDSGSKSGSPRKRGKYRTYTDDERNRIIEFMSKHGLAKTLELFAGDEHKLTKRKLKSWLDGLNKVKGVKGRKSNDPARDQALYQWCIDFQKEHLRPPSRKETTNKALELNGDPNFQASKGWLDKFSRKFNIEFTPLKIVPPRGTKKVKTSIDSEPASSTSTIDSGSTNISPLFPHSTLSKELLKPKVEPMELTKGNLNLNENIHPEEGVIRPTPLFNVNIPQPIHYPQQQAQPQILHPHPQHLEAPSAHEEQNLASLDANPYQGYPPLDASGYPQNFPFNLYYPYYQAALNYQNVYPVNNGKKAYPLGYQGNISMNYQNDIAENFQQQFQKVIHKDNGVKFGNYN